MAVTNYRGSTTPIVAPRAGAFIPADSGVRSIGKWAKAYEPRKTPVLSRCHIEGNVDQLKHEWGQSRRREISGVLGAGVANNATAINFGSGNGLLLQQYHVVEIIGWADAAKTRLDYTTREEVLVTSFERGSSTATDSPTVIRDLENRTDASTPASGNWPTHNSGDYWAICGVAMPHNTSFARSPISRGDMMFNYPQRFYGTAQADESARHTPTYEHKTDQMLADFKEETSLQKHLLERAIVSGTRMEGGDGLPYKMAGIKQLIQLYSPARNQINCSGDPLSAYDLEVLLRTMFKNIEDGGAKTMLMGPDTAAVIDTMFNPYRQAEFDTTSVSLHVEKLKFRWGTLEIQPTLHMPEGEIFFVDFKDIYVRPYKGMNWKTKKVETTGPFDEMAIYGEFTLEIEGLPRFGRIHNFSMDFDHYMTREFI